ncbi:MAG: hypothetical protein LUQ65_12720, partial [Candidatus Helarchaeota archaeon]|nr:hypothetical protein [Candidatus Helarchaeota archaeon]
ILFGSISVSYFISGFKTSPSIIKAFEQIYKDLVPKPTMYSRALRINSGPSFVVNYSGEKVIPDISISNLDNNQGSWLVLLGTPLMNLNSLEKKQEFLATFLSSPASALYKSVEGNFAILCYDAKRDRLIAGSDYNNTTPIFYSVTKDGVFFASHELALARLTNPAIDPFGFYQAINIGATWGSRTRFQNIYKTLPCQLLIIDNEKKLKAEQYWMPHLEKQWDLNFDEVMEKWINLLSESIWKFYECSGRKQVICDFTAGEDTRLILAQCHALGIPFKAQVRGSDEDIDVIVAKQAASKVGFDLIVRQMHYVTREELLVDASKISLIGDGYKEFTFSCIDYATDKRSPLDDYRIVKYCGVPGGEAFRGSYYLRGKAFFPSRIAPLDYKFFTRMKYLLDYHPNLLRYPNNEGIVAIHKIVRDNLEDVGHFPIGIQIDHLLRTFQTCFEGLKYKNPLYLPFATNNMTRSIYSIPPRFKRGGRLTKACTEFLYHELAVIKTQKGVPTIRKTLLRLPLFMPEYISTIKGISSGAASRLLKWKMANKWYYKQDRNMYVYNTILNQPPYCNWISSQTSMQTGYLYNPDILNPLIIQAKTGSSRFLPVLGRVINQELACRWVYGNRYI